MVVLDSEWFDQSGRVHNQNAGQDRKHMRASIVQYVTPRSQAEVYLPVTLLFTSSAFLPTASLTSPAFVFTSDTVD
jgi:hypothetical protein